MKSSAKLPPTVINYLGKQGGDARQITSLAGGPDTGKAGPGGREDEKKEKPPIATTVGRAAVPSRACEGRICQLALRDPVAGPLQGL